VYIIVVENAIPLFHTTWIHAKVELLASWYPTVHCCSHRDAVLLFGIAWICKKVELLHIDLNYAFGPHNDFVFLSVSHIQVRSSCTSEFSQLYICLHMHLLCTLILFASSCIRFYLSVDVIVAVLLFEITWIFLKMCFFRSGILTTGIMNH
jgi:hypothetical protein